ncbi:GNAT family N-acetyltransferase [Fictibacillus aquaticus]|uniref:N-acetyltransferase domain-containing protein n=1 Tax=Fictibacillus aquaticus TaxID=2021314 RepID=A0A235FEG7_9BACL|nr:GNAT family N-acetyltransferase [Fictibacillus aquaticus]OYD59383.1 hypothetical protein CGZ90_05700 [Fictibacillus aquaticus]
MVIREAQKGDIPELAVLMGDLGYPTEEEQMKNRFEKINHDPNYHTLVADEDGVLLGMVGMFRGYAYEKDELYVRIIALVVKEEHRNKRIGKQLINSAEEWAQKQGINKLAVNTGKRRVDSHHFYRSKGFEDTGAGFYKTLQGK